MTGQRTYDLCQFDYEIVRPDRYFPETFRSGTCDACGEQTFVARATRNEAMYLRSATVEVSTRSGEFQAIRQKQPGS